MLYLFLLMHANCNFIILLQARRTCSSERDQDIGLYCSWPLQSLNCLHYLNCPKITIVGLDESGAPNKADLYSGLRRLDKLGHR